MGSSFVAGPGFEMGVGSRTEVFEDEEDAFGFGILIATVFFQSNFFPTLTQENFFPLTFALIPTEGHVVSGLIAPKAVFVKREKEIDNRTHSRELLFIFKRLLVPRCFVRY